MSKVDWDIRWLNLAEHVGQWSKDSTKVGSVIAEGKRLISMGYNGFPQDINDDDRLLDRPTKLNIIIHSELNSLRFATGDLSRATIYTWPMPPCATCSGHIINHGIKRVFTVKNTIERWQESIDFSKQLFKEAGVTYIEI